MRIAKFVAGLIVLLIGLVFGIGWLSGLFMLIRMLIQGIPFGWVGWVTLGISLVFPVLFIKVGLGLLKGEKIQISASYSKS